MAERPLVLRDGLGREAALSAIEPDGGEDLERRFGLCPGLARLRWRPLSPIHPAHQDLHLRERLLLRPPFPLATELDEVFVGPDLEANPE